MGEIVESRDIAPADMDGWAMLYRVKRSDGREVLVEATCTGTAEAVARGSGNADAVRAIDNQCAMAAIAHAERAPDRDRVYITLWFERRWSDAKRYEGAEGRGLADLVARVSRCGASSTSRHAVSFAVLTGALRGALSFARHVPVRTWLYRVPV